MDLLVKNTVSRVWMKPDPNGNTGTVIGRQELVLLNETDSISAALQALAKEKILGAPVMSADGSICKGAVDVLDLVGIIQ